MNSILERRRNY